MLCTQKPFSDGDVKWLSMKDDVRACTMRLSNDLSIEEEAQGAVSDSLHAVR